MGLVRAALSNRAWSTVTSKSPASQKANSDSDSPVDHGKETPQLVATDETPWIEEVETPAVFVKAVPEMIKGPQLSITEPRVARSKARPPPPVLPFPEVSCTEAPKEQKVEAATPEPEEKASGSTDPVGWDLRGLPLPKPPPRARVVLRGRILDLNEPPPVSGRVG